MEESQNQPTLSLFVIAKNEDETVEDCLQSVSEGARGISNLEVILVDPGSTDRTIPMAMGLIAQIRYPRQASVAAGRLLGSIRSSGRFVQFVDGDTILHPDGLSKGVDFLPERYDVASVRGVLKQTLNPNPLARMQMRAMAPYSPTEDGETEVFVGGELAIPASCTEARMRHQPLASFRGGR